MLVWGLAAALFPVALLQARKVTRAWGCPAFLPVAKLLATALFPVSFGHSGLGVPCFLLRLMILYWALLPVVRSCVFLFVLVRACCLVRLPRARRGLLGS